MKKGNQRHIWLTQVYVEMAVITVYVCVCVLCQNIILGSLSSCLLIIEVSAFLGKKVPKRVSNTSSEAAALS